MVEYFRGILFLTTNRPGQIDDAFVSRINIVIGYSLLDADGRRQIWEGFFKKLEADMAASAPPSSSSDPAPARPHITVNAYAKDYVLEDPEVEALKWNGREIRNAFLTATYLARYKAVTQKGVDAESGSFEVRKEHFKSVVSMSRSFRSYVDSIDNYTEAERARHRGDRNDLEGKGQEAAVGRGVRGRVGAS